MKQNSFAYVQNQRIPNEFAHSIYVVKVCEAAQTLGYKTYLLLPERRQPINFQKENIWSYYGIRKNFFKVARFKVIEFFIKPLKHQAITWCFAVQAVLYLAKNKIDIVETIDREMIALLRLIFWYHPQVIYDVHIDAKIWYEKLFDSLALPRVDLFAVNCQYFKNYYKNKGIKPSKIIVLPNGFDSSDYSGNVNKVPLREKLKLPAKRLIVGYIGRFVNIGGERCVPQMLKAAAILKRSLPITVVAIGGPQELVLKYKEMAQRLSLTPQEAIIKSQVKPKKVSQYIRSFDIACLLYPKSNHYSFKMSPLKAIEYMAAGNPIIASDLPSIREILNEKMAFFVKPNSQKELIRTITYIWKNPGKAKKRTNCIHHFIQQFSWEKRQKKIFAKLWTIRKLKN